MIAKFKDFDLINVYVPNSGTNFDYRIQEWDKNIHAILERSIDKPLIYTGDLNVVAEPIDIWNPMTLPVTKLESIDEDKQVEFLKNFNGLLVEERINIKILYDELNYLDIFRHLNPDIAHKYSWWDQRRKTTRQENKGRRIDYFLIHLKFKSLISDCLILDDIIGSDHCPIMLEII